MPVQGLLITLTTSATLLAGSTGTDPATAVRGVIRVVVRNRGTGTGYLGGASVTTSGFPVTTSDSDLSLLLRQEDVLYGTSTGAAVAQILRMGETT